MTKKKRVWSFALALCLLLTGGALASTPILTAPMTTFTSDSLNIREAFTFRGLNLNGVTLEEALAALDAENTVVKQEDLGNNETTLSFQVDFAGYSDATATLFFSSGTLYKGQYYYEFTYASLERIEADILGKLETLYGVRDVSRVQIDYDFQNARVYHWEADANTCMDLMFPLTLGYDAQNPTKAAFKLEYYSLWPTLVRGGNAPLSDLPSSQDDTSGL